MNYYDELLKKNENIYPIKQIINTKQRNYNLERLTSLKSLKDNLVYNSVLKNLEILNEKSTKFKNLISEVLIWSEVSKTGTKEERTKWKSKGYNMFVHNIASAQIYKDNASNFNERVYILIKTHGLVGQYIRGEVPLDFNKELYTLIENKLLKKEELKEILSILNECIIKEVSEKLYNDIKLKIEKTIDRIINNEFNEETIIVDRFKMLNGDLNKESVEKIEELTKDLRIYDAIDKIFSKTSLWYYNAALNEFDIEEQIKILLIISNHLNNVKDVTFCPLMKNMYLDYNSVKRINLYKLRIIQKYLSTIKFDDILNSNIKENQSITYSIKKNNGVLEFNFEFSKVAKKLIEYCEIAYTTNQDYNSSVILLYDLFGFRKDKYDRFYNEIDYLKTMSSTINEKSKILEFITGKKILDVGPGSGVLMDLIAQTYPDKEVYGIDISSNVINELKKKELKENKKYNLIKGNALNLDKYYQKNSMDTIIFSSVIHELFSYIEYDKRKFNHDVIIKILKSAYEILSKNGRIIIRDGIMTDKNVNRIIEFKNKNDLEILKKYQRDFKGRKINYTIINDSQVIMPINDAMEFLYTYTWGENSYALEVQEQFGYFTPKEYEKVVTENLPNSKIVYCRAFLQDGYMKHLEHKINFYDENYNSVDLPNSTYILVIKKES